MLRGARACRPLAVTVPWRVGPWPALARAARASPAPLAHRRDRRSGTRRGHSREADTDHRAGEIDDRGAADFSGDTLLRSLLPVDRGRRRIDGGGDVSGQLHHLPDRLVIDLESIPGAPAPRIGAVVGVTANAGKRLAPDLAGVSQSLPTDDTMSLPRGDRAALRGFAGKLAGERVSPVCIVPALALPSGHALPSGRRPSRKPPGCGRAFRCEGDPQHTHHDVGGAR